MNDHVARSLSDRIDQICNDFEQAWKSNDRPSLVAYLEGFDGPDRLELLRELLLLDVDYRGRLGEEIKQTDYGTELPEITAIFNEVSTVFKTQTYISKTTVGDTQLGRYRLVRILGEGAFGRVYLGFDEELKRQVAIKVPKDERFQKPEDAEQYLEEARTVASLDHPNIVPVHDVGRTDDGSIYIVSKFIEGRTLGNRIKEDRPNHEESAILLAIVAQALQHAHERRLIHRDVKPNNILIDESTNTPFVADFGLAISEEDYLQNCKIAGTPAYMSPEQARGEGHRLDGRSDIFSLGVVFYELLTGKKPFRGSTTNEVLHHVVSTDPPHPREIDDSIPIELERICLKALSKRASDRYSTAKELTDDLRHWKQEPELKHTELQIVPKGLRSFDAADADFFLDLLPGPRNRDGLPESIQFWKTRIEETDPDKTFHVGLIYGPSGCGKSSLMKAGLLPRLSKDVIAIYVEATPDETEKRILRRLRKHVHELPDDLGLVETFTQLRKSAGQKVVVVLDQFEQWLHAHREEENTELVSALRHCDGETLQSIVMIRDDFAMAAARFMDSLDIPIVQGHNFVTVDLFEIDHARKILTKFGQAFEKLPARLSGLVDDQKAFLASVASGLAQDGKVVSVHLALFAEMVKHKPWVPATLEEVGGTEGIGINFLEETFSSRTANPNHRQHQHAAREVLKSLLPEVGTNIKGTMRSHAELLEASGYQNSPGAFNDLLRILDGELRLITPTDPEGFQTKSGSDPTSKYYQLTHDYLVRPLREWLTRKRKETRRGRAELRLSERFALWKAKPDNQHLPVWSEYCNIRLFTRKQNWNEQQRRMMVKAGRIHGMWLLAAMLVLFALGVSIQQYVWARTRENDRNRAESLVEVVLTAPAAAVPYATENLKPLREYAIPLLRKRFEDETAEPSHRLHTALALAEFGEVKHDFLVASISKAFPTECPNIVRALSQARSFAITSLQKKATIAEANKDFRHKARLAIVALHLNDPALVYDMSNVRSDPIQQTILIDTYREWHADLTTLAKFRSTNKPELQFSLCLMIGTVKNIDFRTKQTLEPLLFGWYLQRHESGTHSAAEWAIRKLSLKQPESLKPMKSQDPGSWYFDNQGRTMAVVRMESVKGSTARTIAVATKEETQELFRLYASQKDESEHAEVGLPINGVSMNDSMGYCNWLSKKNNLPESAWSYVKSSDGKYTPKKNFLNLQGYRLPTQEEWQVFCRAGSTTKRYYGNSTEFLNYYAWYGGNTDKMQHVGQLLPNSFGLFDTLGNVCEWCHASLHSKNKYSELGRLAGGHCRQNSALIESGFVANAPQIRFPYGGLRIVKTILSN